MATYQKPKKVKHTQSDEASQIINRLDSGARESEHFFEKYRKFIFAGLIIIVLAFLGYQAYKAWIIAPSEKEAQDELVFAKEAYDKDSLNLALNGNPIHFGFIKIAEQYGSTNAGNLAKYLAGSAYYKLGQFESSIKYLKKFSSADDILSAAALGLIADAYAELGDNKQALNYYDKAADASDNEFTAPLYLLKAGKIALYQKEYSKAYKLFDKIKNSYPKSAQAKDIDKYLEFAKTAK